MPSVCQSLNPRDQDSQNLLVMNILSSFVKQVDLKGKHMRFVGILHCWRETTFMICSNLDQRKHIYIFDILLLSILDAFVHKSPGTMSSYFNHCQWTIIVPCSKFQLSKSSNQNTFGCCNLIDYTDYRNDMWPVYRLGDPLTRAQSSWCRGTQITRGGEANAFENPAEIH